MRRSVALLLLGAAAVLPACDSCERKDEEGSATSAESPAISGRRRFRRPFEHRRHDAGGLDLPLVAPSSSVAPGGSIE